MQGVYKIKNIKTNLVYIGSSIHIERRWKEHQYRLQNNAHHSYKLQNSYNRSKDKSIFHYEVIEEVQDASKLKEREQYWIDYYNSFNNGYNCCAEADNPKYTEKKKRKLTKAQLRNLYYDEFMTLYGQYNDCLILEMVFADRMCGKYYAYSTYNVVNQIIKWFLSSYGENYILRFSFDGNRRYYFAIHDKEDNIFAFYVYKKGKIINSIDDTNRCKEYLLMNNKYDPIKHYLV
jgi:hypothetical protein